MSTVQDHYPERLRAALLIRTPGIFEASWRLIKPWIDPNTAQKVHFLPRGAAEAAALLEFVDVVNEVEDDVVDEVEVDVVSVEFT